MIGELQGEGKRKTSWQCHMTSKQQSIFIHCCPDVPYIWKRKKHRSACVLKTPFRQDKEQRLHLVNGFFQSIVHFLNPVVFWDWIFFSSRFLCILLSTLRYPCSLSSDSRWFNILQNRHFSRCRSVRTAGAIYIYIFFHSDDKPDSNNGNDESQRPKTARKIKTWSKVCSL